MRLFVSHSSKDRGFVESLIELLRSALNLSMSDIRCTSLPGYGLPGGANITDQLRRETLEADAFIAVVSRSSLDSIFTVFEWGARWGANKILVPVLVPGVSVRDLASPLDQLRALSSENRAEMHELIKNIASSLGAAADSPAVYEVQLDKLLHFKPDNSGLGEAQTMPLDLANLKAQVTPILRDELERLSSVFRASTAKTVAELSASGNRYGTALVNRLEVLGVKEVERRCDVIINTWQRLLSRLDGALRLDLTKTIAELGVQELSAQRQEIESVVNAVDMRRAPRNFNFLDEAFPRCANRIRAELGALSNAA
jgi:TIR domain-containing protein